MAIYDVIFGVIEQQGGDQGGATVSQRDVTLSTSISTSSDASVRALPLQDLFRASFVWKSFFPSAEHLFEQSNHLSPYR